MVQQITISLQPSPAARIFNRVHSDLGIKIAFSNSELVIGGSAGTTCNRSLLSLRRLAEARKKLSRPWNNNGFKGKRQIILI
jgi:hypothetical protein